MSLVHQHDHARALDAAQTVIEAIVLNWSLLRRVMRVSTPARVRGRSGSSDKLRGEIEIGFAIWCRPVALTRGQGPIEPGWILDTLIKQHSQSRSIRRSGQPTCASASQNAGF